MFDIERLPAESALATDTAGPPDVTRRPGLGRWTAAVCLLALLVLLSRLPALGVDLAVKASNLALLKTAMRADLSVSPMISPRATAVSGFQARAFGRLAQAAGQRATDELWLRRGQDDPQSGYLSQFELCRLYWDEGRRDAARETCRDSGVSAVYWLEQGYAADQAGDRGQALAFFEMAAAVAPESMAAWHQAGNVLFGLARYEEAIPAFERVLALDATPPADAIHSLGQAYLEMGNPTMARDVLNRGLLIYPNQREFFLVMAATYRQEADLATAESWYVRILQRWPYDAQAWANRAEVAAADARWDDAIDYYQEATALRPEDVGQWLGLAAAAVAARNTPLATQAYQQAVALRPDDAAIWLRAGRFLAETDQVVEARAAFARVLDLQPDNAEAAAQMAALDAAGH